MENAEVRSLALAIPDWEGIYVFGELRAHDIEDWGLMVSRLGLRWYHDDNLPNLLDDGVNWDNICGVGQQRLFQDIMPAGIESMEIKIRKDSDTAERNLQIVK